MDPQNNNNPAPQDPAPSPEPNPNPDDNGGSTYTPPATQADLDRIVQNRVRRVEEKYADYNHLKAEAGKVGGLVAERDDLKTQLDAANAELSVFKAGEQKRQWAAEVAEEKGVPAEALRGETKEEMEAHAETLQKYMNPAAPVVRGDGRTPSQTPGTTTRDQFANALEGLI